jgi:hypothetical protein
MCTVFDNKTGPPRCRFLIMSHGYHHTLLVSSHPEIDDFRMEHSAVSVQQSAKHVVIMRFFLKAESETLIALIRK